MCTCTSVCPDCGSIYLDPQQLPLKHNDKHAHPNYSFVQSRMESDLLYFQTEPSPLCFFFFLSLSQQSFPLITLPQLM